MSYENIFDNLVGDCFTCPRLMLSAEELRILDSEVGHCNKIIASDNAFEIAKNAKEIGLTKLIAAKIAAADAADARSTLENIDQTATSIITAAQDLQNSCSTPLILRGERGGLSYAATLCTASSLESGLDAAYIEIGND